MKDRGGIKKSVDASQLDLVTQGFIGRMKPPSQRQFVFGSGGWKAATIAGLLIGVVLGFLAYLLFA